MKRWGRAGDGEVWAWAWDQARSVTGGRGGMVAFDGWTRGGLMCGKGASELDRWAALGRPSWEGRGTRSLGAAAVGLSTVCVFVY